MYSIYLISGQLHLLGQRQSCRGRSVPLYPNQFGALVDKHSRPPPQPLAFTVSRVQLKLYIPLQGLYFRLLGYNS